MMINLEVLKLVKEKYELTLAKEKECLKSLTMLGINIDKQIMYVNYIKRDLAEINQTIKNNGDAPTYATFKNTTIFKICEVIYERNVVSPYKG